MTDVALRLRDALEYALSVHHGDVALIPDQQASYQQAAYWRGITLIREFDANHRDVRPLNRLEQAQKTAQALEHHLPIKQAMLAELMSLGDRITKGVGVLAAMESLSDEDRIKRRKAFEKMTEQYALLAWRVAAPLPSTTLCICRHCWRVNLPAAEGAYSCSCGAVWHYHVSWNVRALPDGFWSKYAPGDKYTRVEPVLDGCGRVEVPVLGEVG